MRGIQVHQYLEKLEDVQVSDLPAPKPRSDQYLISVHACAANFFDLLQLRGKYQTRPPFPWIGGFEFSGVILSVPDISNPRYEKGDKVIGAAQGAYAEQLCALESELVPMPEGWSFEDASALYYTAPTAYAALVLRAGVKAGDWVLVHGAAGGIGLSAIQTAYLLGAKVIASTTGRENMEVCEAFGSEAVVDFVATPKFEDEVMRITGGHGVDVVLDPVGLIDQSLRCAAWCARLVTIGFVAGKIEKIAMNRVLLKNVSVVGVHWGAYAKNDPVTIPKVWTALFELIKCGKYKAITYQPKQRYQGLEDVKRTLQDLEGRRIWGKAVVSVKSSGGRL